MGHFWLPGLLGGCLAPSGTKVCSEDTKSNILKNNIFPRSLYTVYWRGCCEHPAAAMVLQAPEGGGRWPLRENQKQFALESVGFCTQFNEKALQGGRSSEARLVDWAGAILGFMALHKIQIQAELGQCWAQHPGLFPLSLRGR